MITHFVSAQAWTNANDRQREQKRETTNYFSIDFFLLWYLLDEGLRDTNQFLVFGCCFMNWNIDGQLYEQIIIISGRLGQKKRKKGDEIKNSSKLRRKANGK